MKNLNNSHSGFFESVRKGQEIVVIKVGTSSLINSKNGTLALATLAKVCELIKNLKEAGFIVALVSSGAVGVGCQTLQLEERPPDVSQKQACAAVGQLRLMRYYSDLFQSLNMECGQVLLTSDVFIYHQQYLNARNTFRELFGYGIVPIINANDTVSVDELTQGDNDSLSARVAILCEADWLVMCTDVDHLYTSNPRIDPDAKPIYEVRDISQLEADTSTKGTAWGTGGMETKLNAARMATAAGCNAAICNASRPEMILDLVKGAKVGTKFYSQKPERGRKRWILSVPTRGSICVDDGALEAVKAKRKSLFSAGVCKVTGEFRRADVVAICNARGDEFARGLVNYSHSDLDRIMGKSSTDFADVLEEFCEEETIHRSNICLLYTE